MNIEQELYKRAVDFIKQRYPIDWGGAAVMYTEDGDFLISVAPEVHNEGASLCIETGAICEAHKLMKKVTHSICVVRDDENSPFKILTPCGICQERLFYWGDDVKVGVYSKEDKIIFKTLKEVQPYYWYEAYRDDE
ncbi:cytidine deaminase [Clostridium ganghwense]|uniref:Cytidine deaminase n=1 Tax=Clostridium ganghwense TaxID=312089 RepID=A0ABT4CMH4_9CLOT|nr:cytidine deaminase [Clostridium ganghwense]MCY6370245.1 cytidine deaminase [Clostridium ganghwense]